VPLSTRSRLRLVNVALGALCVLSGETRRAGAQQAPDAACGSDSLRLTTPTGTLVGSLACPPGGLGRARVPLVLVLAGSGPTDRNGNSALLPGRNDGLRMLADSLAARGIASVRYDKRGVGASRSAASSEAMLRFDSYVDDAAAWIRQLRRDRRFGTITVVGHSEGALAGMIAAGVAGADGFVSLAGPGRPAGRVLRSQLAASLPRPLLDETDRVLEALEAGRTVDSLPPAIAAVPVLAQLFRPSVQPYLVSLLRRDPAVELARLRIPVLVVQGTTDVQVAPSEASELVRARAGLMPVLVDGMNHVLKLVPAEPAAQARSYQDPSLPVPGPLVEPIATFVRALRAAR
jgi:pimeloyl-ACP methyl ester carboxylesterase